MTLNDIADELMENGYTFKETTIIITKWLKDSFDKANDVELTDKQIKLYLGDKR